MKIAGIDEVGRGPLAGPVVAACVILDNPIDGLKDSKLLSEKKRNELTPVIKDQALAYSIGFATEEEIDAMNIHNASLLAMRRSMQNLKIKPDQALFDGIFVPSGINIPSKAIKKGDQLVPVISAASILAKTYRDALMVEMSKKHPHYGFEKHKGYPTKLHILALQEYGICPIHRKSFGPVKKVLKTL